MVILISYVCSFPNWHCHLDPFLLYLSRKDKFRQKMFKAYKDETKAKKNPVPLVGPSVTLHNRDQLSFPTSYSPRIHCIAHCPAATSHQERRSSSPVVATASLPIPVILHSINTRANPSSSLPLSPPQPILNQSLLDSPNI
jgi:hypothetical protein